jgi:hypothetical protein
LRDVIHTQTHTHIHAHTHTHTHTHGRGQSVYHLVHPEDLSIFQYTEFSKVSFRIDLLYEQTLIYYTKTHRDLTEELILQSKRLLLRICSH